MSPPLPVPVPLPSDPLSLCSLLHALTAARLLPAGLRLHAHALKSGFLAASTSLSNHLINFYSKCQLPHYAHRAFLDCPLPILSSWSSLLSAFSQNDLPHLALLAFRRLLRSGLIPDHHALPSATKSCAALSDSRLGCSLHGLGVKIGFSSDVFVASSFVDMHAKCGLINEARRMFDEMPEKNVVTWSGMIYAYAQVGNAEDALRLFKAALVSDVDLSVNDFTYSGVLRVCSESTFLELGSQIHSHCVKTSFVSSPFVGSSLISLYSKCGIIDDSYKVFGEMNHRNLGLWNAMLIACAQHGHTQNAFQFFRAMEASGTGPNFITFLCLLYACSHGGLVEQGKQYFQLMSQHGIDAGPQHYACMVDLLGRAGKMQEAMEFVNQMPIEPPDSVWAALLTGCQKHNDSGTAAYVATRLVASRSRSPGAHVLLCNAYAAERKYEEVARMRKAMRDMGVKKETGLSWVEFGSQIHTFASGDQSHGMSRDIYEKLEEVEKEIKQVGYVPDTRFVLRDVESEEKIRAIRHHSERIAVAFGLVVMKQWERPIRVMKNLRVCGDCHVWLKCLTKCTGRIVILRDNNRFHRFEGGICSCGDYW